ncbi:hypothetical protein LINGRAHAP2_LOCUS24385 [Linum grandiflorum]
MFFLICGLLQLFVSWTCFFLKKMVSCYFRQHLWYLVPEEFIARVFREFVLSDTYRGLVHSFSEVDVMVHIHRRSEWNNETYFLLPFLTLTSAWYY